MGRGEVRYDFAQELLNPNSPLLNPFLIKQDVYENHKKKITQDNPYGIGIFPTMSITNEWEERNEKIERKLEES